MDPRPPGDPATSRLGPYRLLHCIAQGGMGEVHLATLEREAGFRKRVAIKRALPQLAGDPRVAERFEREARLSAVLAHRHIVQVFDFGRSDGAAWLAMEYVHGVDLKAVQDRLGAQPLPAGVALEIGLACAAGLHHAHGARDAAGVPMRLVHRDVSPHNVLLSFDGDVKLTDFGLADAATGPDGPDGLIQGKYAYMSPEQARGGAVDARADQYALGVVLYELLSGARAFQGFEGPLATLDRVASGRPLRPLAELPVAPALALVVGRAMALDPEARYPDMQHFAGALRAAGAAAGVTTGEPPLSDWLRAVFPERLTAYAEVDRPATPPVATEVTAAALEPIGTGGGGGGVMAALERTLDAVSPAALDHTVEAAAPAARVSGPSPAETRPAPAAVPSARRWLWPLAALAVAGGWALWPAGAPSTVVDARPPAGPSSGAPATAARGEPPPSVAPVVRTPDAAASATPTIASDAPPPPPPASSGGSPVATRSAPAPRPARPVPSVAAVATAAASAVVSAAPSTVVSAAPSAVVSAAPSAVVSAAPSAAVSAAPRIRLSAEGARVRDADGASLAVWRPLAGGSVLAQVLGGAGPPVSIRLLASGRLVRANVTARPHGEVRLDGVDLGGTPLADVPLRTGRRVLVVRAPDGSETHVTIEVAGEGQDGVP